MWRVREYIICQKFRQFLCDGTLVDMTAVAPRDVVNTRSWKIVRALADGGPMSTPQIVAATGMPRSTVQARLNVLWYLNIIDSSLPQEEWVGRTVLWTVNPRAWNREVERLILM